MGEKLCTWGHYGAEKMGKRGHFVAQGDPGASSGTLRKIAEFKFGLKCSSPCHNVWSVQGVNGGATADTNMSTETRVGATWAVLPLIGRLYPEM